MPPVGIEKPSQTFDVDELNAQVNKTVAKSKGDIFLLRYMFRHEAAALHVPPTACQ